MNENCFSFSSSSSFHLRVHPVGRFWAVCTYTQRTLLQVIVEASLEPSGFNVSATFSLQAERTRRCRVRKEGGCGGGGGGGGGGAVEGTAKEERKRRWVMCKDTAGVTGLPEWEQDGTERKMKGGGRVRWEKRKRRVLVKLKAGQRQMEIQGDWYACHSGKSQRYE